MKVGAYLAVLATILPTTLSVHAQEAGYYQLGVQDRLRLHVHEWPILTGEFVVGANGSLVLPLIGSVPAKGLDPSELANEIANRLRIKADLSKAPDTTVDISQYRPFYILGGVERPGEYQYRPGMLVVNAVAMAGGMYRPPRTSDWGFERDVITGRGDLRLAAVKRDEFKARELRLKAEAEGKDVFPSIPQDMSPDALKLVDEERILFKLRLDRYRSNFAAYGETISLIEAEIKSLQGQMESTRKLEQSVTKELEDTRGLVARALAPAPRILPIERTLAQIERELKEINTAILRARQQINVTKIQRETLTDERRNAAATELQTLEVQRRELNERLETAERLISGSSAMLSNPQEAADSEAAPSFIIIRQRDSAASEIPATETTVMLPGDVVKVFRPQDVSSSRRNSRRPRGAMVQGQ
jgi:polysaccharide biosynthesis/export protein ExoF